MLRPAPNAFKLAFHASKETFLFLESICFTIADVKYGVAAVKGIPVLHCINVDIFRIPELIYI